MQINQDWPQGNVVITGCARNVANSLERTIDSLLKAFQEFDSVSIYIVESDSTDSTLEVLEMLKRRHRNLSYVSLGSLANLYTNRLNRLAYCRQHALQTIKTRYATYDYAVVADLDGVNNQISKTAIKSCWDELYWDVCTANQDGPYYDILALRAKDWSISDCWQEERVLLSQGLHPMKARRIAVNKKQKVISPNAPRVRVDSAFGGLAIYKMETFLLGSYESSISAKSPECEHVVFHQIITELGKIIIINPRMINLIHHQHRDIGKRIKYWGKYLVSFAAPNFFSRHFTAS